MLKQVLVIGVGEKTDTLLHRITSQFKTESTAFSATWVVPRVPETVLDKIPDTFPLPLTADALNKLYYQRELREWCAPNWKMWGTAIISNRLHGTLATYYHLQQLYKHIESLINDFGQERKSLQIYLVAHAHDPFASGAFVHLAYLLNEQAVKSGYRVYGCVILPDIIDDPISAAHGDSVHDGRLHYATAYALFKELHFVTGRDSFYKNHHPDVNIDLQNESPFQTGDCYLFGGSVDENGQPLTYETVVEQIATYIYDNARTPLAGQINMPLSQSTFTSVRTLRRTADKQQDNYELNALLAVILRRLVTNHGKPTINLNSYFSPNFMAVMNTRFQEAQTKFNEAYSNIGLTADVNRTDGAHRRGEQTLNALEMLYTDATEKLYEYTALLDSVGDKLLDKAIAELHPDAPGSPLFAVRNEPDTSFVDLDELYNGVLTALLREIDNVQLVFDARRHESLMAAERLRVYRVRVVYSLQIGRSPLFMLFMLGIVFGVAYTILMANLLVQTVIWTAISVVALPAVVVYYGQRRQEQAERQLVEHQRTTITLQRELATLRVTLNYLHGLYDALERELVDTRVDDSASGQAVDGAQEMTYAGQIVERLEAARVEVERRRLQAIEDANAQEPVIADSVWAEVSARILDTFWTQARSKEDLTSEGVRAYLESQINDRNLVSVNRHEIDLIQTILEDNLKTAAPLLATKTTQISEEHQEELRYYIRFLNWRETTTEAPELTKYLLSKRIQPITIQDKTSQKQLIITAVRTNIPLRAVQEFERYRDAYCKVIQVRVLDDFHNYRAHMHPTRWGVATPSPEIYMMSQVAKIPHFVMMIVTIMHLAENMHMITTLCDRLHLYHESTKPSSINYDELCGGLQDNYSEVRRLVNEARAAGAPDSGSFAAFIEYMGSKVLHSSEVYADWEVWAVEQLQRQYRSQQNIPLWNQLITYLTGTETLGG